jgi:hypothetical protein
VTARALGSEKDDAALARLATRGERHQDLATPAGIVRECGGGCNECSSIFRRVGDEQDHMIDAAVPALERNAPLESLGVIDHGLRFDAYPPINSSRYSIPGASVARSWKGHLGPPTKARVEAAPKPFQQSCVPCVSDRVAFRVRTGRDDQTEGGCEHDERAKWDVGRATSFKSTDLRMRDARRCLERPLAHPGADARSPKLPTKRGERLVRQSVSSIAASLTSGHRHQHGYARWPADLPVLSTDVAQPRLRLDRPTCQTSMELRRRRPFGPL